MELIRFIVLNLQCVLDYRAVLWDLSPVAMRRFISLLLNPAQL